MIRRSLLAVLLWQASFAFACGYCVEDKIAACYDYAVIESARKAGNEVAFFALQGKPLQDPALAAKLKAWPLENDTVALVIGGPDGLEPAFREAAHERIRLSDLTLPHAMVRVVLAEQLYRAWSINAGHPYHRE